MTLQGRRIVVLGGSSGIGLAVGQAAAREGATVVIASSRRARVDVALKTLPEGTEGHALDLADEPAVRAVFERLGNFDHLVFSAGESLQLDRLTNTDVEAAKRFFGLRYWGAYLAAKHGSGSIREGGSIVFTSGIAGQRPRPGWSVAASICAAMEGLTRACGRAGTDPGRYRLAWCSEDAALGRNGRGRSRGAVPANGRALAGRPYWGARRDRGSLSLPDGPELRDRTGIGC